LNRRKIVSTQDSYQGFVTTRKKLDKLMMHASKKRGPSQLAQKKEKEYTPYGFFFSTVLHKRKKLTHPAPQRPKINPRLLIEGIIHIARFGRHRKAWGKEAARTNSRGKGLQQMLERPDTLRYFSRPPKAIRLWRGNLHDALLLQSLIFPLKGGHHKLKKSQDLLQIYIIRSVHLSE